MDNKNLINITESILQKKMLSIWFTGFSGSGKTTLAVKFEKELKNLGIQSIVLDGDQVRKGLNNDLGFSDKERFENIRRVAEVSKLFSEKGIVTLCAFICPLKNMRELAKNIIGKNKFILVYLDASFEACENRDNKGLYSKARKGDIENFTGLTANYEKPDDADLILDTVNQNIDDCINKLAELILPLIMSNEQ